MTKLRVIYLKNGKEKRSAWFLDETRARKALQIIQSKYGEKNAILYRD